MTKDEVREVFYRGLEGRFNGERVLALIPDHTRTIPLPFLFRLLVEVLGNVQQVDFMVALGTHPPLDESEMLSLVGLSREERAGTYGQVGLLNHAWRSDEALVQIGTLTQERIKEIAGDLWHPSLGNDVPVRINGRIFDYDHILILGPTFPHEVAGFSGGAKYLFPGISGPEMINVSHWLGALMGVMDVIGVKENPVRAMLDAAADFVPTPVTLVGLVVEKAGLAGVFIGDLKDAWTAAVDLSAERHIKWCKRPFQTVLSCAAPMYEELWTGGKAMYKLEPVVANGGELIIYAPHLNEVSQTHGEWIYKVGYHVLPYFLNQWERFKDVPLSVLAHSCHVRGNGRFLDGKEYPRIQVTLSSQIGQEACEKLSLGYRDPAEIDVEAWEKKEDEEVLVVRKAGEVLYRLID
ncbi:MAG: lactate racemase domain-containing protein [Candidatus Promineifilaceae bacterium]